MGDGGDATKAEDGRNNGERLDLARLLSRSGQRAAIDGFLLSLRCPEQFAKLPEKRRRENEASNAALRERFSREVLALIVDLQECILTAYDSRRAFVETLKTSQLNTTFLSRRLGGDCDRGPHGSWWLLELIAEHCARGDESVQDLRKRFAQLWHAAYGDMPRQGLRYVDDSLVPATEPEITELIAKLIDPPQEPSPSARDVPAAGNVPTDAPEVAPLFDGLPDAVLFVDSNGTVVRANSTARELFDAAGSGLGGRGLLELLPSFDINRLPRLAGSPDGKAGAERQPPLRMAARCIDGRDLPAEVHSTHLIGGRISREQPFGEGLDGQSGSYVGDGLLMVVVRDLTGSLDLETELVRQQRQTEMILRTASEGIIRVDAQGRIALANAAAGAALGFRTSELGGQALASLVHGVRVDRSPLPYAETPLGKALGSGRACRLDGQLLLAKGGRPVPVDLSAAPVREGDHNAGAVITFTVRKPTGAAFPLTAGPSLDRERAEVSRLRGRLVEYHQLLIQVLARLDGPGADVVERLCGGLLHSDRHDLLRSARVVRDVLPARATELALMGPDGARLGAGAVALDQVVREAVEVATARIGRGTRFIAYAPPTAAEVDTQWLSGVLAQLIVAVVGTEGTDNEPVVVSAAERRGEIIRIDVSGSFTGRDPAQLASVREKVREHGGVMSTVEAPLGSGHVVVVLEVPLREGTTDGADGSVPAEGPDRAAEADPKSQTPSTRPVQSKVPESSPVPPADARRPHKVSEPRHEPDRTEGAMSRLRQQVGRSKENNQEKLAKAEQVLNSTEPEEAAGPTRFPGTRPYSIPPDDTNFYPSPTSTQSRTIVADDLLLTVTSDGRSEIHSCPPGDQPRRPVKYTADRRAELTLAALPPVRPGPVLPQLPLLERQKERERLVRHLARGRSVRVTGLPGSGRTRLLNVVAEDCSGLAPDGVVRLTGFRRTAQDLLYDLFHAVYDASSHRPGRGELLELVAEIGAIVVLDDLEFGGKALGDLLDCVPECAFLMAATPDAPAPSADSVVEEVLLGGLDRAGCSELLERAARRVLTEEESNWAENIWLQSEGLPLHFVQAGALLRQRDQLLAERHLVDVGSLADLFTDTSDGQDIPLPTFAEAFTPAELLASRLSESARETLKFAVALGGEVPNPSHLPALVGDTHADAALAELANCALVSPVGSRYRLAAGVKTQLEAAGYATEVKQHALTAARHYAWWARHPSVTPERVCAEEDAVLAALAALLPLTTPPGEDEASTTAVLLARGAAPEFAAGLHWSAWERSLRSGMEVSRLASKASDQAYFHHELGSLALCSGQLEHARTELEAALILHGALANRQGSVAVRRALTLVADRAAAAPPDR